MPMASVASVIVTQEQAFAAAAREVGVTLTPSQLEQFRNYYRELLAWNRRVNLTAITDYRDVLTRHFLDSLTVLPLVETAVRIVDVGTGAGFPGIPLLIARPDLQVCLVDSVGKKTAFCRHVVSVLGLAGATIITARAEDLGRDPKHREAYEAVVSRAVDRLPVLAEYLLPLCAAGGRVIVPKKGGLEGELACARAALAELGGRLAAVSPVTVPGLQDGRALVIIEKRFATPDRYPRRAGMPHKRPL